MPYDLIVIGGGASGLFCAITAGQRGKRVLVLDSSNKVGKKILMSGGGRCNFTNLNIDPECFLSNNPHFCKSALSRYTQWDFISLVEKHGIAYEKRKHGKLFCKGSSKQVLAMLLKECEQAKVKIHTDCVVETITAPQHTQDNQFILNTNQGKFRSDKLVIASGGLSIPKMGASNFGYRVAEQFNHPVIPTSAGLVPFTLSDPLKSMAERLSGVSKDVLLSNNQKEFSEDILFTHRGLSGPACLQLSSYWQVGQTIAINLFPDENMEESLLTAKQDNPRILIRNFLNGLLPKALVNELQEIFWPDIRSTPLAEIPDKQLKEIAANLAAWRIKPSGTEGYRTAEVTLGGVDTDCLSSQTMESKSQAGLYFIGEVVDVTGHLGGYNFQWAWSSAYAAGMAV